MGNNWIEWNGGECPVVDGDSLVDCKRADGDEYSEYPARSVSWYDTGEGDSIVAWRLSTPEQKAWDVEGLPPEGIECEVKSGKESWTLCKVVHSSSAGVAFIYLEEPMGEASTSRYIGVIDCVPARPSKSCFRPLRTEAERKREEAIKAMINCSAVLLQPTAYLIYSAIAAGEIPGVKLD